MTKGLQGSGKSTWAKGVVSKDANWKRINKDDLRQMIDGGKWSKINETYIIETRNSLIELFLKANLNVIVDDTNFSPNHEKDLRALALKHGAEFEVNDSFLKVPLEECIENDKRRVIGYVGKKVIMDTYNQYLKAKAYKVPFNPKLTSCYIFDIDGTLALMNDRSPFEWDHVDTDLPNESVVNIYKNLRKTSDAHFIILSGRDEICRTKTENWLIENIGFYDALFMRPKDDMRKDSIVKKELYEAFIKDKYNVLGVFDDRNQVVELWRSIGLTCFQVADGDF